MVAESKKQTIKPRLFVPGRILSYRRSRENIHPNHVLIRMEGVQSLEDAKYYVGKKVAYTYKAATKKNGSKLRVRWGVINKPHGNSGVVRAKFERNLCGTALGQPCRVYMFPASC